MKYRTGFVSNSSSSSFVILGNSIDIFDCIDIEDVKKGKIYAEGMEFSEGCDVFQITLKIYKELKKHLRDDISNGFYINPPQTLEEVLHFYKAETTFNDEWGDKTIDGTKLAKQVKGKKLEVIVLSASHHSNDSWKKIEDYYIKGEF